MLRPWFAALVALAAVVSSMTPTIARAAVVAFEFTAVVDFVDDNGTGELVGVIGIGDVFSGILAYDTSAADDAPDDPEAGLYFSQPLGPNRLTFSSPTFDYAYHPGEFALAALSVVRTDGFHSFEAEINGLSTPSIDEATIYLDDGDGAAFASDALPTTLDLASFQGPNDRAVLELVSFDFLTFTTELFVTARITSLRPVAIPEPAAIMLVGIALLVGAAARGARQGR